ncbi:MAG: hypothetical protein VKK07_05565 [Merismopediaceae bacterium]|nr:hypothetical protein [Merismopediaceae bacterium]
MEHWPDDFTRLLNQWLEPTTTAIADLTTEVQETLEDLGEALAQELTVTLAFLWEEEEPFHPPLSSLTPPSAEEEAYGWLNPKIPPAANVHPACRGCQHYHGRVYNNSILVCGMHPYGVETEQCADWEGETSAPL